MKNNPASHRQFHQNLNMLQSFIGQPVRHPNPPLEIDQYIQSAHQIRSETLFGFFKWVITLWQKHAKSKSIERHNRKNLRTLKAAGDAGLKDIAAGKVCAFEFPATNTSVDKFKLKKCA